MFPDLMRDDVFRLETRRLWLRWPRQADAADLVRLAGDRAVAETASPIPHPCGPEQAQAFLLEARRRNLEGRALTLAVAPRSRPASLIGIVSIHPGRERAGPELGCWLGTEHCGAGLATEAARGLIDAFFAYAGGMELAASAGPGDPASRRVIEKCGFAAVGSGLRAVPGRGGLLPADRFRLDRRRWESLRARGRSDRAAAAAEAPAPAAGPH